MAFQTRTSSFITAILSKFFLFNNKQNINISICTVLLLCSQTVAGNGQLLGSISSDNDEVSASTTLRFNL